MNATLPTIKLGPLEGPYDLIIELIQKKGLDLSEISLKQVMSDFFTYIKQKPISAEIKGSFIIVASTLLLLKVKHLIPTLLEEEEEEISNLTERLAIYKLYRLKAQWLRSIWGIPKLATARMLCRVVIPDREPIVPHDMTPAALGRAFSNIVTSLPVERHPTAHLSTTGLSLAQCLSFFTERLKRVGKLIFQKSTPGNSVHSTATSFLAVLEMARSQKVTLYQEQPFDNIVIRRKVP